MCLSRYTRSCLIYVVQMLTLNKSLKREYFTKQNHRKKYYLRRKYRTQIQEILNLNQLSHSRSTRGTIYHFYRATLSVSAVRAVARCPYVRPSARLDGAFLCGLRQLRMPANIHIREWCRLGVSCMQHSNLIKLHDDWSKRRMGLKQTVGRFASPGVYDSGSFYTLLCR